MRSLADRYTDYPLFRVAIPYILGLAVGLWGYNSLSAHTLFLWGVVVLLIAALFLTGYSHQKFMTDIGFGLCLNLCCFVTGTAHIVSYQNRAQVPWSQEEEGYRGIVVEVPRERGRTLQMQVRITDSRESDKWKSKKALVQLSLYDSISPGPLFKVGDALLFSGRIRPPKNTGNPGEMDYASYLREHGISGTCFIPSRNVMKLSSDEAHELMEKKLNAWERIRLYALLTREVLLKKFQSKALSSQSLAVISALTLGDRHLLSTETYRLYSKSGAAHILAISGLHLSILYGLLQFLLLGLRQWPSLKRAGQLLLIVFVWCFVFIAGMPVSLQRAAIMCTLFSLTQLWHRNSSSINSLALSALVLLLFNPLFITDVGFQLSFIAVFFILCFSSWATPTGLYKHKILHRIWQLLVVSCCAQLGVAPLVIHYFHSFPTYFLLTNLFVIPLAYVLIITTLLFFVIGVWPLAQTFVAGLLDEELKLLQEILTTICSLPASSIPFTLSAVSAGLCYLLIFAVVLWIRRRNLSRMVFCLTTILLLFISIHTSCKSDGPYPRIWFYNNSACPAALFSINRNEHFLWTPSYRTDTAKVLKKMRSIVHNHWEREGIHPVFIGGNHQSVNFRCSKGLILFDNRYYVMLSDSTWITHSSELSLPVEVLYICRGFKGNLNKISRIFHPRQVILDTSLSDYYYRRYQDEARELGWPIYSIKEKGALKYISRP